MKIVLCDDDRNSLYHMEDIVKAISPEAEVYRYDSADELIGSGKIFDIAFLDIEMGGKNNGFRAAEYVKRQNSDCVITFFTNYDSYSREGYKYRAYRFILKDEGDTLIKHHFSETIKEYYRINGKVSLICGSGKQIEYIRNIMYIKMADHYGEVYMKDGYRTLWRKTLSNIEPHLHGFDFVRCHNSYMVNMDYVKRKHKNQLILDDGTAIPIGRKYIKTVQERYRD